MCEQIQGTSVDLVSIWRRLPGEPSTSIFWRPIADLAPSINGSESLEGTCMENAVLLGARAYVWICGWRYSIKSFVHDFEIPPETLSQNRIPLALPASSMSPK